MQKQKIAKPVRIRQQDDEPADDEEDDEEEDLPKVPKAKAVAKKSPKSAAKKAPKKASAVADPGAAAKAAALRKALPMEMADDEDADDGEDVEVNHCCLRVAMGCHGPR